MKRRPTADDWVYACNRVADELEFLAIVIAVLILLGSISYWLAS